MKNCGKPQARIKIKIKITQGHKKNRRAKTTYSPEYFGNQS